MTARRLASLALALVLCALVAWSVLDFLDEWANAYDWGRENMDKIRWKGLAIVALIDLSLVYAACRLTRFALRRSSGRRS